MLIFSTLYKIASFGLTLSDNAVEVKIIPARKCSTQFKFVYVLSACSTVPTTSWESSDPEVLEIWRKTENLYINTYKPDVQNV